MSVRTHTYIAPSELRDSPTMSAANAAQAATDAGRTIAKFTVGDIAVADKPTKEEKAGWMRELEEAAKANPKDAKYQTVPEDTDAGKPNVDSYATGKGTDGFRAAAAFKFSEETGVDMEAKNVAVGTGAKGVLAAIGSYFKPGEEVIMAGPGWPTNFDVLTPGVKIIEVDTNGRGLISPEQLSEVLKEHPNAKGLLINTPNNPTGAMYDDAERAALMKVIRNEASKDMIAILDNPYGKILFSGDIPKRSDDEKALFAEGRAVEVRSVSKEYGLAGRRVGWMLTKNDGLIKQMGKWNSGRGGLDSQAQNTAQSAILFGDKYVERNRQGLAEKRDIMVKGIGELQNATMETPPATIYAWVDFKGLKGKAVPAELTLEGKEGFIIEKPADALKFLVEAANIVAVPGEPFYAPGSSAAGEDWHFRMGFSGAKQTLEKAMADLKAAEGQLKDPKRHNKGDEGQSTAVGA
ncbi:MAG: pyridoxal phosphate-dependent aminotransferase [Rickettsiales bacterium]